MFKKSDIELANKTSRNTPAVGSKAIVPAQVRKHVTAFCNKQETTILDFGAGKAAAHTMALIDDGFNCTAYEFGNNTNDSLHDKNALDRQYDIVFASNVLNVQTSNCMVRQTLTQITDAVKTGGKFFANYPVTPRKSFRSADDTVALLRERFTAVTLVGGTVQAPLWMCVK